MQGATWIRSARLPFSSVSAPFCRTAAAALATATGAAPGRAAESNKGSASGASASGGSPGVVEPGACRSSLLPGMAVGFVLGSGATAAACGPLSLEKEPGGCGAAGPGALGPPPSSQPPQQPFWDLAVSLERLMGGLSAAAATSFVSGMRRSAAAQQQSEPAPQPGGGAGPPLLGRHFIADAAAKAAPAVVNVTVDHAASRKGFGVFAAKSSGSGFIIDPKGTILTNAHVVTDAAGRHQAAKGSITVTLKDGRIFEGEVVSFDRLSDLAVVTVKPVEPLPAVKLGTSTGLRVGEWVVSLGSPLHLQNSVTCGIISCVDRKAVDLGLAGACPEYIQTDAPINQGSSGGPLINLDGEVIGVTSMKAVAADGVSFAIPIDTARDVVQQLSERGRVIRPYIGIKMLELNPMIAAQLRQRDPTFPRVEGGILVVGVTPGSPADQAGLQMGDVIVAFSSTRDQGPPGPSRQPGGGGGGLSGVSMSSDLVEALAKSVGSSLAMKVLRTAGPKGAVQELQIKVTASEAVSRE